MVFNYTVGSHLSQSKSTQSKKPLLITSIICNLGLLGYFKYSDFLIENINLFTASQTPLLRLALPLAISFFTFQQIAYLVDSYKLETSEYSFSNYALFVTFFPQLIAGPIVHHKEMMPQFSNPDNYQVNFKNISIGLYVFAIGLFKKVFIADTFAVWATSGFTNAVKLNFFEAWCTSLSYSFQLYFDFSGYCDMAVGAALIFNILLPINFNSPYKSLDIQDFWRRWHITLSRFLKDYIYVPLGGNRGGTLFTYRNLMITFILGGIWHGAGWTFIFWGFLHGFALIIHRLWQTLNYKINKVVAWFITFNFVNIAWVFFRATSWDQAIQILSKMFSYQHIILPNSTASRLNFLTEYGIQFGPWLQNIDGSFILIVWILVFTTFTTTLNNSYEIINKFQPTPTRLVFSIALTIISFMYISNYSEFLYFNF